MQKKEKKRRRYLSNRPSVKFHKLFAKEKIYVFAFVRTKTHSILRGPTKIFSLTAFSCYNKFLRDAIDRSHLLHFCNQQILDAIIHRKWVECCISNECRRLGSIDTSIFICSWRGGKPACFHYSLPPCTIIVITAILSLVFNFCEEICFSQIWILQK